MEFGIILLILVAVVAVSVCLFTGYQSYQASAKQNDAFNALMKNSEEKEDGESDNARNSYPWHSWKWTAQANYKAMPETADTKTRKILLIKRAMEVITMAREFEANKASIIGAVEKGFLSQTSEEWQAFTKIVPSLNEEIAEIQALAKAISEPFETEVMSEAHKFLAIEKYKKGALFVFPLL